MKVGGRNVRRWLWAKLSKYISFAVFVIGLAGLPADISTWSNWLDELLRDKSVERLAAAMVQVADLVNQWPVRVTLTITGLILLIWPMKRFWRIRHEIVYRIRKTVDTSVWVDRETAIEVIRQSKWADARMPRPNLFENFSLGESPHQVKMRRFGDYCMATLNSFATCNPNACRQKDNAIEYDEAKLRSFLAQAYDQELQDEFGSLPSRIV